LFGSKTNQRPQDSQAGFSPITSALPSNYLATRASRGWYIKAICGNSNNQGIQFHSTPNNIVGGGIKYVTHIDNTPTNFVPVLQSNEIRKMTELNYGPLP
jgi:hypothetical protein